MRQDIEVLTAQKLTFVNATDIINTLDLYHIISMAPNLVAQKYKGNVVDSVTAVESSHLAGVS